MDILIFIGQSNMQGSTGEKDDSSPVENAFEYKYLTNSLESLKNPVGEDIGDSILLKSAFGNGSLIPSFCKEYIRRTGKEVVAIHTARGDTSISEWQKGTERFSTTIEKIKSGIEKIKQSYKVGKIFIVWLQGESDALKNTGTEKYLEFLIKLKNDLKESFSFCKFCIIRQGRFAEYAEWDKRPRLIKRKSDKDIMSALDLAPKFDKDFIMLTRICAKLSVRKKYLNAKEFGPHYNNSGMEIIGKKAGKKLAKVSDKI